MAHGTGYTLKKIVQCATTAPALTQIICGDVIRILAKLAEAHICCDSAVRCGVAMAEWKQSDDW